ncbi:hypothetical protein AB0K04_07445 [Micromonospora coxensis]|uniref:hypothetical protein n=1 Tax=Micromonospora coxensis TaxID=356852 RepID=UPI00341851AB
MRLRTLRRAGVLAVGLATLAASSLLAAAPAQAAASCSGTVTYSKTVSRSGSPIGELVIYYNSTNGGTNSACFYHRGVAYGTSALTGVQIARCAQRSGEGRTCDFAALSAPDEGSYAYYAGPVGVTGTADYCVSAKGWILWAGSVYTVDSLTQGC